MKQTKTIPFDWEFYQANKDKCRVITSHETPREVTQLTNFDCSDIYPLVGVIVDDRYTWAITGYYSNLSDNPYNLRLEVTEEVVEGYANLYRNKVTGKYVISEPRDTKDMALLYFEDTFEFECIAIIPLHEIEKQTNK